MEKVLIIAEAGVNHNGSFELAKKMVNAAKDAGADLIKFQTFRPEAVISKFAPKAEYQKLATGAEESQLDMARKLALSAQEHKALIEHCNNLGIGFLSAPFDLESIDLLNSLGLETFKIPSGEITNLPYLKKIGGLRKKIIISTGMADLDEIRTALEILKEAGTAKEDIVVLHCNTAYPTPPGDVNLRAMLAIRDSFSVKVGYSDHSPGVEVAIAAVALGACILEKHFTLGKNMPGPDHKASLDSGEFKALVKGIRNVERALGNGIKRPSESELKNINIARKSIVANKKIKLGEVFNNSNLTVKRPGNGISPMQWNKIVGLKAKRDFEEDELIDV